MSDPSRYDIAQTLGFFNIDIAPIATNNMVNDTRILQPGDVFCATIGNIVDGRQYIDSAIRQGAALIIVQCNHAPQHGNVTRYRASATQKNEASITSAAPIKIVQFYQLDRQLFALAKAYYQAPQQSMTIVGVTGTNGKTSSCQIIAKLLTACGQLSAVIGTIGAGVVTDALQPINNTTPGPTELHQLLAQFSTQQITNVAMEVSSHGLAQHRVNAGLIDIAVFTNLSRDHLDYHETMDAYANAKRAIFTGDNSQIAILNGDDAQSQRWLAQWPASQDVIIYGRTAGIRHYPQFVFAEAISHNSTGLSFMLATRQGSVCIDSPLMGDFNVDNLLAAIAVALSKGVTLNDIAQAVTTLTPVIGRMESFSAANKAMAIVDYAHSPDALANALAACRQHCQGELWVVFGCGGDRDQGKRALMGEVAERHAEHVVITNDNPRTEAAELIVNDILSGCRHSEKITVMLDRKQAVLSTLSRAKPSDVVLLAGKGHEDYIIIGTRKYDYNEREVVREFYRQGANS